MKIPVWLVAIVLLWLAGGCQQQLASRLAVGGVRPDFLIVVVVVGGLISGRLGACGLGFAAGLIHGGLAGANMGACILSRTVLGFLVGSATLMRLPATPLTAGIGGFVGTFVAQLLFMFLAPPPAITSYLLDTIGIAMINAALAAPLFLLVERVIDRQV